jgi:G3E family GTPase
MRTSKVKHVETTQKVSCADTLTLTKYDLPNETKPNSLGTYETKY